MSPLWLSPNSTSRCWVRQERAAGRTEDLNCPVPTKRHTSAMWSICDRMGKLRLDNYTKTRNTYQDYAAWRGCVPGPVFPILKKKVFLHLHSSFIWGPGWERTCAVAHLWRSRLLLCESTQVVRAGNRHLSLPFHLSQFHQPQYFPFPS